MILLFRMPLHLAVVIVFVPIALGAAIGLWQAERDLKRRERERNRLQ